MQLLKTSSWQEKKKITKVHELVNIIEKSKKIFPTRSIHVQKLFRQSGYLLIKK